MADESDNWRDWAASAWGNIGKQREDERLKSLNFVAEEGRIKRDAPFLWSQCRAAMKAMCDAFNKAAGSELLIWDSERGDQALIRIAPSSTTFHANFDMATHRLQLDGKGITQIYSPVIRDGSVLFSDGGINYTPQDLAKRFLDFIVKRVR